MNSTTMNSTTPEPAADGARRTRTRLVVGGLALAVWLSVLALVTTVGVPTMATWFGASRPSDRPTPLVSLALGDDPTYEWAGQGRGVVHLTYTASVSGTSSTSTTVSAGTQATGGPFRPTATSRLDLSSGRPANVAVAIPVTCTTRTKVGVRTRTPGLPDAEVFTWVLPTTGPKGDPTCKLI